MTARLVVLAAVLASSVSSAQLLNDQGPPLHRVVHRNTFALRYNPLGLLYDGRFVYRLRLYQADGKALRDNFIGLGLAPTASPAFFKVGPYVEVAPLTVLTLWATFQFSQYFGTFDQLQGMPGAQSVFSDTALRNSTANRQVTNGWELHFGATLQLKVGPIVIKDVARMMQGNYRLRDGERVYYDQFFDTLAPNGGWSFTNDLDLLWQGLENKLVAGARYTATTQFYDPARHFDPNDPVQAADNSMHRVGPFIGYTFFSEDGRAFNNPTVFLLVQWWLKHRFRTGVDSSQALPLMGVGFQITGDFLPVK